MWPSSIQTHRIQDTKASAKIGSWLAAAVTSGLYVHVYSRDSNGRISSWLTISNAETCQIEAQHTCTREATTLSRMVGPHRPRRRTDVVLDVVNSRAKGTHASSSTAIPLQAPVLAASTSGCAVDGTREDFFLFKNAESPTIGVNAIQVQHSNIIRD